MNCSNFHAFVFGRGLYLRICTYRCIKYMHDLCEENHPSHEKIEYGTVRDVNNDGKPERPLTMFTRLSHLNRAHRLL